MLMKIELDPWLNEKTVRLIVGVSGTTLRDWERRGIFPRRRLIGPQRVGWRKSEIDDWSASRPEKARNA